MTVRRGWRQAFLEYVALEGIAKGQGLAEDFGVEDRPSEGFGIGLVYHVGGDGYGGLGWLDQGWRGARGRGVDGRGDWGRLRDL